jgi:hypothetical protein
MYGLAHNASVSSTLFPQAWCMHSRSPIASGITSATAIGPAGVFIATQIDLNSPHEARQMRQFYRRGTLADRITISPVIAEGDVRFFRLVDQ